MKHSMKYLFAFFVHFTVVSGLATHFLMVQQDPDWLKWVQKENAQQPPASDVETGCSSEPKGWECPAGGGCPGGGCSGDWKEWVAAHNIYRCMHDVPPVVFNKDVFQSVSNDFENRTATVNFNNHGIAAPAELVKEKNSFGENLFLGSGSYTVMDVVSTWYDEIDNCDSFPGCSSSNMGTVLHFTAMMWQGVRDIGCLTNSYNVFACHYKGLNSMTCNTPNSGGDEAFKKNVFPRSKSFSTCKAEVQSCGLPVSDPNRAGPRDSSMGKVDDGKQEKKEEKTVKKKEETAMKKDKKQQKKDGTDKEKQKKDEKQQKRDEKTGLVAIANQDWFLLPEAARSSTTENTTRPWNALAAQKPKATYHIREKRKRDRLKKRETRKWDRVTQKWHRVTRKMRKFAQRWQKRW